MYINYLDYYIPEEKLEVKEIYNAMDEALKGFYPDEKTFVEFSSKYFSTDSIRVETMKSHTEMFQTLLERFFLKNIVGKDKVTHIIVSGEYENNLGNIGHYIQKEYGLENANVVNISGNYCANIEQALSLSNIILKSAETSENDQNILIITGNKLQGAKDRVVGSYGILGDATGLVLMSNKKQQNSIQVDDVMIETNGALYKMDQTTDQTQNHLKSYKKVLKSVLEKNNITPSEIDHIVLHNANVILLEYVIKSMGFDINKIYKNPKKSYGHMDTVDIVINLQDIIKEKEINTKDSTSKILTVGVGGSGTYASCLCSV